MTERDNNFDKGKNVAKRIAETTVDILVALARPGNSFIPPLQPWEKIPAKGAGSDTAHFKIEPKAPDNSQEVTVFKPPAK